MSGLRRLCLIIFALSMALCLCALALPLIGPYQSEAQALLDNDYVFIGLQVTFVISALFVVVTLLRALFTPRRRKTVVVSKSGKDQITVTTKAISSQATNVIEGDGNLIAEKVHVQAKKNGKVSVDVRVRPRHTVNITQEGQRLHDDLAEGLAIICGDNVHRIHMEFLEAEAPAPAQNVVVERIDDPEVPAVPASVYEHAAALEASAREAAAATDTAPAAPSDEVPAHEQDASTQAEGTTTAPHGSVAQYFALEGQEEGAGAQSAAEGEVA